MNELPESFIERGLTLGLLLTGWGTVIALCLTLICVVIYMSSGSDFAGGGTMVFGFIFLFMLLGLLLAAWPYDGRFWHYYEVSGHVEEVSNVLSEADGELTRQPVVTLDTVERPLVVDDPRAVSLLDRDVVLRCEVGWNYQAADTYTCKIVNFSTN